MRRYLKVITYKFKLWKINNSFRQLDMDMQCSNMTYNQYLEEYKSIENELLQLEKGNQLISR